MQTIIGIDLGTHCGYAVMSVAGGQGSAMVSGAWDFTLTKYDSPALRVVRFKTALASLLALDTVSVVFYELVRRHRGVQAAHVYGALMTALMEVCNTYGVPYQSVTVQEAKKHVSGKGNASKDEVMKGVRRLGFKPVTEDEADAIAILLAGREKC